MKKNIIAKRFLYLKNKDSIIISISKAYKKNDNLYYCNVYFEDIIKFNCVCKGIDEIDAIKNSIMYISTICKNSKFPEFFLENGESLINSDF